MTSNKSPSAALFARCEETRDARDTGSLETWVDETKRIVHILFV